MIIPFSFASSSSRRISWVGERRTRARQLIRARCAHLHGHCHFGRLVKHLLHGAVVALAQLLVQLELVHIDGEGGAVGEVDALRVEDGLAAEVEGP